MMNMKAMHKDFWMEIRKSKARFISIFMIVALGVAFFSGIQASSPDMRFSGDAYYDETNLMDIKVVGTQGLTEDDVAAVKQVDGVENAEGAYGTDVMCGEGEHQERVPRRYPVPHHVHRGAAHRHGHHRRLDDRRILPRVCVLRGHHHRVGHV